MKKGWLAAMLALMLVPAALVFVRFSGMPRKSRYPILGVDVSRHQGTIDWAAVKGEGVSFAYLKASEGGDHRDPLFDANRLAAKKAGLAAGAYHFYTFCKPGAVQARNFLGALGKTPGLELPPAVDLEFVGNCAARPSVSEMQADLAKFSGLLKAGAGRAPVYYVTRSFERVYGGALPPGAAIWIRSVLLSPRWTYRKPWVFWQFSGRGRMSGIKGPVDLDVFHGSEQEWAAYVKP